MLHGVYHVLLSRHGLSGVTLFSSFVVCQVNEGLKVPLRSLGLFLLRVLRGNAVGMLPISMYSIWDVN